MRFVPDDPGVWRRAGIRPRVNSSGGVQLRLDAIDALETHFSPQGSRRVWRQPPELAVAATEALLRALGFTGWHRDPDTGTISDPVPGSVAGTILTAAADVNGRPIALILAGDAPPDTDAPVAVSTQLLRATVNQALLADGLVYPTFYSELADSLRSELAAIAAAARAAGRGVWAADVTTAGFTLTSPRQLETEIVVLPKLFRRLAEYLAPESGSVSLAGFEAFLAMSADPVRVLPSGTDTTLAELVRVDGQRVALTVAPELLVFAEKQTRFRALTERGRPPRG